MWYRRVMGTLAVVGVCGCGDATTDVSTDTDTTAPNLTCAALGLPEVAFDASEGGTKRRELAEDFSVLTDAGRWKLSENWSGCESYVFITDNQVLDDGTTFWNLRDIDDLIALSPDNAHYFFVSTQPVKADAEAHRELIRDAIRRGIKKLPAGAEPGQKDWWSARLHVATQSTAEMRGWLGTAITTSGDGAPTGDGLAIDRFQRVRGVGSYADVLRYSNVLNSAGGWPWEPSYRMAANEVRYFNFEAERQARLDAEDATIVSTWQGDVLSEFDEIDVAFPDDLSGFDTLEIDLSAFCPDDTIREQGNCGAWDYLAHVFLQDADDAEQYWEMARFITTYHRAGRYLVDATPMLALLKDGGTRRIRYNFAPSWNVQPTSTFLDFRLTNQGKGYRPSQIVPLWSGGGFGSTYNDDKLPVDVEIPAGAKRVELRAIITGHGADANQCSEFCNHQHSFTVGAETFLKEWPIVGDDEGCMGEIELGTVPNQSGTWWFGRGGWCPGRQVDPWIQDVTALASPGSTLTVSYEGLFDGQTPPDGSGNIEMKSWIVVYE